eukprot:362388-Chlamydomonas_euryale.AAC.2
MCTRRAVLGCDQRWIGGAVNEVWGVGGGAVNEVWGVGGCDQRWIGGAVNEVWGVGGCDQRWILFHGCAYFSPSLTPPLDALYSLH